MRFGGKRKSENKQYLPDKVIKASHHDIFENTILLIYKIQIFLRLSIKLTFTFTNLTFMPKTQKFLSPVNLILSILEFRKEERELNFTLNEPYNQRNYQVI